jgi:hypothetical protein
MINEGSGSVLAGFVLSYAVLAVGWILFGLATLRAGIFPRWASLLVVAGAAIAFLPLPRGRLSSRSPSPSSASGSSGPPARPNA